MEKRLSDNKKRIPKCVLKCTDSKTYFQFPRNEAARKTWLERIGLDVLPCAYSNAKICNNHFSERMIADGGKRITSCAMPDRNIPGKLIDVTPDGNLTIVKPRPMPVATNLAAIPRILEQPVIITSYRSKCFLKCKNTYMTFAFPHDKPSRDVWAKLVGYSESTNRKIHARICSNHFSGRMLTEGKGRRLTRCAIPDINLPGQTIFKPEDENLEYEMGSGGVPNPLSVKMNTVTETILPTPQNEQNITQLLQSELEPLAPVIIEPVTQLSHQEIVINPIENIKTAINQPHNKEGILHVFQPGIERKQEEEDHGVHIALPEDVVDADSECVLKCSQTERLFRFPAAEIKRQEWLKQIGLTHCFFNTKICSRHFSDAMYTKTKKKLAKFAYPDINIPQPRQPRIKDASRVLNDFRLIQKDKFVCDVLELPEYICVLTVFKEHTEVDAVVNGIKYVKHKTSKNIPKREREVQVQVADLIESASRAISTDDYSDDFEIEETVDDYQELDWIEMISKNVFASKVDMYECLICGEITVGHNCNVNHSRIHKKSSSLCFQCGRLFSTEHMLKVHEKGKHLNKIRKAMRCPKLNCKKAFHSKKLLFQHVDQHTRYTKHKCGKCLRLFSSSLKLHCHQVAYRNCWKRKQSKRYQNCIKATIK